MKGYVYILTSQRNGTLRLFEHQTNITPGFTSRYGVKTLVWFELAGTMHAAITRFISS